MLEFKKIGKNMTEINFWKKLKDTHQSILIIVAFAVSIVTGTIAIYTNFNTQKEILKAELSNDISEQIISEINKTILDGVKAQEDFLKWRAMWIFKQEEKIRKDEFLIESDLKKTDIDWVIYDCVNFDVIFEGTKWINDEGLKDACFFILNQVSMINK